ncbi:hypothetical protein COBT_000756 [Conglomerata obtusa]
MYKNLLANVKIGIRVFEAEFIINKKKTFFDAKDLFVYDHIKIIEQIKDISIVKEQMQNFKTIIVNYFNKVDKYDENISIVIPVSDQLVARSIVCMCSLYVTILVKQKLFKKLYFEDKSLINFSHVVVPDLIANKQDFYNEFLVQKKFSKPNKKWLQYYIIKQIYKLDFEEFKLFKSNLKIIQWVNSLEDDDQLIKSQIYTDLLRRYITSPIFDGYYAKTSFYYYEALDILKASNSKTIFNDNEHVFFLQAGYNSYNFFNNVHKAINVFFQINCN